jgi:hypothetical protein
MQAWRPAWITIGLIASAIGVAGCGHKSAAAPTARSVILEARAAALSAHSVDVVYTASQGQDRIALDETFDRNGNTVNTVYQNGTQVTSLLANNTVYFKISPSVLAFYGQPASLCAEDCGKYIAAPASRQQQLQGQMSIAYGVNRIVKNIPTAAANYRGLKLQKAAVSGVPSLCVTGQKLPIPARICVTANGRPRFTEIRWTGKTVIQVLFTHWNNVPPIPAPSGSEILTNF